jgi:hypothetical protein
MCIYIHIQMCTLTYIYKYMFIYMYIYIYIYVDQMLLILGLVNVLQQYMSDHLGVSLFINDNGEDLENEKSEKNEKKIEKNEGEYSFSFLSILNELNDALLNKLKIYVDEQISWIRLQKRYLCITHYRFALLSFICRLFFIVIYVYSFLCLLAGLDGESIL